MPSSPPCRFLTVPASIRGGEGRATTLVGGWSQPLRLGYRGVHDVLGAVLHCIHGAAVSGGVVLGLWSEGPQRRGGYWGGADPILVGGLADSCSVFGLVGPDRTCAAGQGDPGGTAGLLVNHSHLP